VPRLSALPRQLYQSGSDTDMYVANEGTLHLDHIYLDVMCSVIKKLWKL